MRENGSPPPVFEFDENHDYLLVTLPVHPKAALLPGEVTGEVTGEVARLLAAIVGEIRRAELQVAVGLKHEEHFRGAYLKPALALGLAEMTIPD